ncbi:LuxR family transcriptional regulator [Chloroflexales bacterium ZM16-3]|nr:LuxR family transcriptional regulator [Chloroflexales bacterium ZM16-3]
MPNDVSISDRELEILRLVATGASNQQIAQQLSISANTVKVHLHNIFSKIGVVSRTEATVYAIRNGLLVVPAEMSADVVVADLSEPGAADAPPDVEATTVPDLPPPRDIDGGAALIEPVRPPAVARRTGLWVAAATSVVAIVAALMLMRGAAQPVAPVVPTAAVASVADQRWFSHAPMPVPREGFALAAYDLDRRLYVIGGRDGATLSAAVDRYDPGSDRWVTASDPSAAKPTAVADAGAVVLRGNIYVPGGIDASGDVRDILEIYDPRDQHWQQGPAMPAPRSRYALVVFEGRLYVIGGWDGTQSRSEVFIYDPELRVWQSGPSLPSPRQTAGAVAASGWIYLVGGNDEAGALRECLRLDPTDASARWSEIAPLPEPVTTPGIVAPVGLILAFDPDRRLGYQYDQESFTWTGFSIPDDVAISAKAVMLGPSIYLISGTSATVPGATSEYHAIFTTFLPGR